ncbi:MAG: capsular polysaccharide biosynthesis protein [Oscillibacter sp.]|nr:capsular polysaccharide biosynthesis protein [Oscillibacter sp.]
MTDYHCHILPRMDDGAKDLSVSLDMIRLMMAQGVDRIAATPHFYAHREKSAHDWLQRRQDAYRQIADTDMTIPYLHLGAEVAIEHGISRVPGIHLLTFAQTPYILLEFPYAPFAHWMLEEVFDLSQRYGLTPVLAHIHRYAQFYTPAQMSEILQTDAVFQINNEAFRTLTGRRFVLSLIRKGCPYILGSDAHNMTSRRPDWDFVTKKVSPDILAHQENLFAGTNAS